MRLGSQNQRGRDGFTLVELLIVITIIAVLAMLTTVMVGVARKNASKAAAASDISAFKNALALYRDDEGVFPGHSVKKWDGTDEHFNSFPELFEAVLGESAAKGGKGGRNAPYWEEYKFDLVAVLEDESDPEQGYIEATRDQLSDFDVRKFYMDPFGQPYVYRENSTKKSEAWMWRSSTYDLWSCGPNGKNESLWADDEDLREESDDITSWN